MTMVQVAEVLEVSEAPSLALIVKGSGLTVDGSRALQETFAPFEAQLAEWERQTAALVVTDASQTALMRVAREARLGLKKVRVAVEHKRKELKDESLKYGRAVDAVAGHIEGRIKPLENRLLDMETFAERIEAARKTELRASRREALLALDVDPNAYADLGEAAEETWASILETAQAAKEAKIEAARQAEAVRVEAERIAAERRALEKAEAAKREAERQERERVQAEENARLRKEAEEREVVAQAEREKAAAELARVERERQAAIAAERAERERVEAAARREREAAEAEARKEREAREAAERALATARAEEEARRATEESARLAAQEAEEKVRREAAAAPDREKVVAFAAALRALALPAFTTDSGAEAGKKLAAQMKKMCAWVDSLASEV